MRHFGVAELCSDTSMRADEVFCGIIAGYQQMDHVGTVTERMFETGRSAVTTRSG